MVHRDVEQLSLFGAPATAGVSSSAGKAPLTEGSAPTAPAGTSYPLFASVVIDIPSRALSDPFAYGVEAAYADDIDEGSVVLVSFGRRMVMGYVVALSPASRCRRS